MILAGVLAIGYANAQTANPYKGNVGINTAMPQTTLDIAANTADGDKVEGLMIPRITYAKMQAMKANLTEYHDGLMVYITDHSEMNTGIAQGDLYVSYLNSPYFVYNHSIQDFIPLYPSGLTAINSGGNGGRPAYVLADKASILKANATVNNSNSLIGEGAVDLTPSSISSSDISALGNFSFSTQSGLAMGEYSIALGRHSFAKGEQSFAMQGGQAHGDGSIALGYSTAVGDTSLSLGGGHAEGIASMVLGSGKAEGDNSAVITSGTAKGDHSFAIAGGMTTNTFEIALGKNFNTDRDIETDTTASSPTRQVFSVGRNNNSSENALIILRNAHTGIGLPTDIATPANSKPTEMLDVNGNIKVRGTNASITDGATCTNAGTISYATDGNFYGCTGQLVWKKLNNQ